MPGPRILKLLSPGVAWAIIVIPFSDLGRGDGTTRLTHEANEPGFIHVDESQRFPVLSGVPAKSPMFASG